MEILRKSLKSFGCAAILFLLLTFLLAVIIRYTAFPEKWSHAGMIAVLSVTSLFLGILEGKITAKRGILTGIISSAIFMFIVLAAAGCAFNETFDTDSLSILYIIPMLTGMIGAIAGTNSNK